MSRGVPGAIALHAKLAGWGTQSTDMGPAGPNTMFMNGDAPVDGVNAMGPELANVPPHWMGSVGVVDVDEAAHRAQALGGTIVSPPATSRLHSGGSRPRTDGARWTCATCPAG